MPSRSRRPMPLAVWASIACYMMSAGELAMSLATMVMLSAYLRPGEMAKLRRHNLVAPSANISKFWSLLMHRSEGTERSKTGSADDSVALDADYIRWLPKYLEELTKGKADAPLWPFAYGQYAKVFAAAVKHLRLGNVVVYQSRHSGPSTDRARNSRSLEECKKSARWASWRSVTRYEKAARLTDFWHELPLGMKQSMDYCEAHLGDILCGRRAVPRAIAAQ